MRLSDRLSLLFLLATYPLMVLGVLKAMGTFRNDVADWLVRDSSVRTANESFLQQFGVGETLIVSWQGCTLSDTRLAVITEHLQSLQRDETQASGEQLFASVVTGSTLVDALVAEAKVSRAVAIERLRGVAVAQSGEQTGIILRLTDAAQRQRGEVVRQLIATCKSAGLNRDELRISGVAHDLHSLDQEGLWSPLRAVPFIVLCSFLLAWLFLKRFDLALFTSSLACYVGILSMSLVYISGAVLSAVVWTLPTLTMLLTMSAIFHFLGYYRFALRTSGQGDAVGAAFNNAWRPTLLCAITTAVGLFSLTFSRTPPVQEFGFFGGVTVLLAAVLVLWCLPAWLRFRPVPPHAFDSAMLKDSTWMGLARRTSRGRHVLIGLFLSIMVLTASQIPSLKTSIRVRNLFPESGIVIQDAQWLEENFVDLSTVELLLELDAEPAENDLARLKLIHRLSRSLHEMEEVSGVASAVTFVPVLRPERQGVGGVIARRTNAIKLRELRENLPDAGYLRPATGSSDTSGQTPAGQNTVGQNTVGQNTGNTGSEVWRISLMVSNLDDRDHAGFLNELNRRVDEIVGEEEVVGPNAWSLTGSPEIFHAVERQFLSDLKATYATALVVILLIMLLVVRSLPVCVLLSLPNVFPALLVLGVISALGLPLDVASLMTASVALGIGVDDTLHYALWWRKRMRDGFEGEQAVANAMSHCGTAMLQTSVITGLSISLYAFCGFLPTVRFGLLLSAMLFAALVADLFFLPALLSLQAARRVIHVR